MHFDLATNNVDKVISPLLGFIRHFLLEVFKLVDRRLSESCPDFVIKSPDKQLSTVLLVYFPFFTRHSHHSSDNVTDWSS